MSFAFTNFNFVELETEAVNLEIINCHVLDFKMQLLRILFIFYV